MFIEISNKGEIEIESFKLLGASTKRDDGSKIGFFGSGIKYSIAFLLRNNLEFKVFSGKNEIKFSTKVTNFRDQTFEQILVNGIETSLTTSWGTNWNKWQIFREIVSNSLDEGEFSIKETKTTESTEGKTKIFLKMADFGDIYKKIENYFLLGDKNIEGILKKEFHTDLIVYKKGVRVVAEVDTSLPNRLPESIFNYNISSITLNEERIASRWDIEYSASRLLTETTDKGFIKTIFNLLKDKSNSKLFEYNLLSSNSLYGTPSEEWLEVLENQDNIIASNSTLEGIIQSKGITYAINNSIVSIPDSFYFKLKDTFGERFTKGVESISGISKHFLELNITKNQQKCIAKSLSLIQAAGIDVNYPIKVVKFFKDGNTLGMAGDDTIYLSEKLFDTGHLLVMSTILEEYIHLRHKVEDETRLFQDAVLNLLANVIYNNVELN